MFEPRQEENLNHPAHQGNTTIEPITYAFDLSVQAPLADLDSLWIVHNLDVTELKTIPQLTPGVHPLYVRKEMQLAFELLTSLLPQENGSITVKRTLGIIGPPGVGKSCLLVGWAGYVATSHINKTPVLWIHKVNRSGTLHVKIVSFNTNNC